MEVCVLVNDSLIHVKRVKQTLNVPSQNNECMLFEDLELKMTLLKFNKIF